MCNLNHNWRGVDRRSCQVCQEQVILNAYNIHISKHVMNCFNIIAVTVKNVNIWHIMNFTSQVKRPYIVFLDIERSLVKYVEPGTMRKHVPSSACFWSLFVILLVHIIDYGVTSEKLVYIQLSERLKAQSIIQMMLVSMYTVCAIQISGILVRRNLRNRCWGEGTFLYNWAI